MKLIAARIREFKSVWDSNEFKIDDITCLVGKNEAGKTGVLQALYRLNPIIESHTFFDVTDDYPRSEVENYQQAIETNARNHATVVEGTFKLDESEKEEVAAAHGINALASDVIQLSRGYKRSDTSSRLSILFVDVRVNENAIVRHLVETFDVPEPVRSTASKQPTVKALSEHLAIRGREQAQAHATAHAAASTLPDGAEKTAALEKAGTLVESSEAKALAAKLPELLAAESIGLYIWSTTLRRSFPKFLYFDEYYQLSGHENLEALKQRKASNTLSESDHPLLGLIELARLDLDKILGAQRTQELKNKLQGASNHLSKQILKYWSQNRHLRMSFDVRPALPGDPEGMREGTNIWGEVEDTKHLVSTGLGGRVCFTQSANQLPTSGSSIRNAIYRRSTRSSNLYAAPWYPLSRIRLVLFLPRLVLGREEEERAAHFVAGRARPFSARQSAGGSVVFL